MFKLILMLIGVLGAETPSGFLHDSKEKYQAQAQEIHIVMGNESGDLDSIVSSIAYAYLLNQENTLGQSYIPLLNIHREELAFRKDVLYLFKLLHISADDLLFIDDEVPLNKLFNEGRLRLNLVDHNLLHPKQEHLSAAVERIVDHHVDENKHYPLLESKVIETVGSATTLIAEKMLSNKQMITPELALFLLGPILIDTSNLQSVEKTTDKDKKVVEALLPLGSIPPDFYEKLLAAKNDISDLTPSQLLSKDFKEYLDGQLLYGISSLPSSVSWWREDEQTLRPILEKYAKDRELSFLILLMQGPKRKIIVYSPSPKLLKSFESYVQTDKGLNKILSPVASSNQLSFYEAEKSLARKQLQPLFDFSKRV